jgi:hypothetical protein
LIHVVGGFETIMHFVNVLAPLGYIHFKEL